MVDILPGKPIDMKDVIIIGAGGHGAEIDEYIQFNQLNAGQKEFSVIGFLDDDQKNYSKYRLSAPLLGGISNHTIKPDSYYVIGIANLKYRRFFIDDFVSRGASFTTVIHCNAYISPSAKVGVGVVIGPYANLGPNVTIGDFTLINSRCSIGHDTVIGKYNFISPNVCFSGFSEVGDENLFGINAATIPRVKIGNGNRIMAGMVLDKNIGDESTVFFRYKEKVIAFPKSPQ